MTATDAAPEPTRVAEAAGGDLARRLALGWLAPLLVLAVPAFAVALSGRAPRITIFYFVAQDLGVLALATVAFALISLPAARVSAERAAVAAALARRRGALVCAGLCAMAALIAFAGWFLVYHQYPLSLDEYWATIDAQVFQHGTLLAKVAPEWRAYVPALQPEFRVPVVGDAEWGSFYLPVNAGLRAVFGLLGSQALAGPVWAALSIATVFSLARRYWPHRPDAALVAAVLLATSSQLVITAMTSYAMSAHLALNLAWLWLFQRKGALSQAGAALVAFLATGLHQVIFHPLFAAPFVLQLWLARRWPMAAFHTLAYAAICVFWASYWGLALHALGLEADMKGGLGVGNFLTRSAHMLASFQPGGPALMAVNLVRFIAWQNPLAVALGGIGAGLAVRERHPAMWPLVAGLLLTTVAMLVILPYQGHGWGFRYLHGLLGNLVLVAAFGWVRLVEPASAAARKAWAALGLATAFAACVALPIRGWQASSFIRPYAVAHGAIEHAGTDVVLVDPRRLWYGSDLVRNDPFLVKPPKVMNIDWLSANQVEALCRAHSVAVFDQNTAAAAGITRLDNGRYPQAAAMRTLMRSLGCGTPVR